MTKSIGQAGPPSDTHSVLGRRRAFIITDLVLRLLRELKMDKNKKRGRFTKKQPLFNGASGDTELFEKASNINGFQGGRVANNLYISPFWATVFQTAAFFLYPNSSVVIRVENLCFLSPWLAL